MHINETIRTAHTIAKKKGFWKKKWNLGEKLMLITSELGEALEADRTGRWANKPAFNQAISDKKTQRAYTKAFQKHIKDTVEDEMADAVIRLFDLAGKMNIDLEYHIHYKMQFNSTRDKLHGKKY